MSKSETGAEILKTDKRGRVQVSTQRREELLGEFDKSGLSAPKFAEVTGVKYQTLAGWLCKRRHRQVEPASSTKKDSTLQWLETVIDQAQAVPAAKASTLVVRLPSGALVEVASATQVGLAAALLRAWEKSSC